MTHTNRKVTNMSKDMMVIQVKALKKKKSMMMPKLRQPNVSTLSMVMKYSCSTESKRYPPNRERHKLIRFLPGTFLQDITSIEICFVDRFLLLASALARSSR